jgi:putative zinc finger protein
MTITIEQLSAYYDRELAPDEHREVESHLPGCPDCETTLRRWEALSRAVVSTPPSPARSRRGPVLVIAGIAALLLVGSSVAIATGLFNEIFKIGDVSGVASRPVTLEQARVANLPIPRSEELPGGWKLNQVQLVLTPTWRSVDLQYRRPGSRGMGITVWSQDITVNPTAERRETITVSGGVPVEIGYGRGESGSARFTFGDSTVIIRFFTNELDASGVRDLAAAWIEQAR